MQFCSSLGPKVTLVLSGGRASVQAGRQAVSAKRRSQKKLASRLGGGVRRAVLLQLRPSGLWPIT